MKPLERINYSGDIEILLTDVCIVFQIGKFIIFTVIETGYEDCNIKLETSTGLYLVKIFSKQRTTDDVKRYVQIMEKVLAAGVHHPKLEKTNKQHFLFERDAIQLIVMQFIQGRSFLEMERTPDTAERQAILEQAARIHSIEYHPPFFFDSWAIPNIQQMFKKVGTYIQAADLPLVKQAIAEHNKIPVRELPQCFVHGDFTKANILKGDDGKIYILDFSVANWYPRIQELAVIAANLLYEKGNSLAETCTAIAKEYSALKALSEVEIEHLYSYALAGVAMEFMGAHQEKYINGNSSEETEYWLNLGRTGLRQALEK